ncbi:hypothetical protein J8L70_04615 [Pseudoalteromonas sp. MMG010]|uniref:hypothetical protein n=1 Tax=Pseudoalteromonas sp. MMG010 TaxID=2822685 RepID=UPI001B3A0A09|nr:hypothetical protein [Pseudoalteromonas sp. MMG010]MBQ4832518.1 hypothetical protein [Pseudoalteromonas sp. MMG010]
MKKKILLLGFSTSLLSPFLSANNQFEVFTNFDSEIYTEAQPIKAFIDDFDAPLTSGDSAFTYNLFEIGAGYGGFKIGLQSRFDYVLNFDPDTALYTHTEKNDLPFEERFYTYYLDAKQVTSNGVFVSYDFKLLEDNALTITPKLSVFASTHYQDGTVDGHIYSDEVEGDIDVDYYFSKDILFKKYTPSNNPESIGYSFDIFANWQVNNDLQIGVSVKDLFYKAKYDNSGYVTGQAVEVPYGVNSDGNVISQPTVSLSTSDNNNTQSHDFEMKMRVQAFADYRINDWFSTALTVKQYDQDTFSQLKGRIHFWDHWKVQAGYESKSEAMLFGIENDYFGLNLQTDNFDLDKAYYANINWYINIKF